MIAQNSITFLIIAGIAIVAAAILHYGCKFYVRDDVWSFLSKCIVGWFGAWLGSPVAGHWLDGLNYNNVYYIPAAIGAFGAIIIAVDVARMFRAKGD